MTIFNQNNEATKFDYSNTSNNNSNLRSLLTSTSTTITKPIQIKNDTYSGGHHFMPNHLQQNYLDASCLTKAKLNECLNNYKPVKHNEQNQYQDKSQIRVPFKSHKPLDWTWSYEMESGCNLDSPPLLLSNDSKSVCFHPFCIGCFETNAIRGNKPLKLNALTYWEVSVAEGVCAGTSVMVGVGRSSAKLNSNGYINLIGADSNSWGLSNKGHLWHDNQSRLYCHPLDDNKCNKSIRIGCLFDGYNGRLAFFKNGVCLGVAFENLINSNEIDGSSGLYPMVSSTVSKSVIRLEIACENFATLKEMCRERVQQQIMERILLVAGEDVEFKVRDRNFYETFIYGQSSLAKYLPKTIVDYLSNK